MKTKVTLRSEFMELSLKRRIGIPAAKAIGKDIVDPRNMRDVSLNHNELHLDGRIVVTRNLESRTCQLGGPNRNGHDKYKQF